METAGRVIEAYDRIASAWRSDRGRAAAVEICRGGILARFLDPLPVGSCVIDVGCGCGEPLMAYLAARGLRVTGLDGSARMLDLARLAVPTAAFVLGDMRTANPGGPFDAVLAWDSVFHLPRCDHASMFTRFRSWLRPGGRLLLSLGGEGGDGDEGFTSEMHGETFFYSGHEPLEALRLLEGAGFRVEHWEVDDSSSRGHIAVLAVRNSE